MLAEGRMELSDAGANPRETRTSDACALRSPPTTLPRSAGTVSSISYCKKQQKIKKTRVFHWLMTMHLTAKAVEAIWMSYRSGSIAGKTEDERCGYFRADRGTHGGSRADALCETSGRECLYEVC